MTTKPIPGAKRGRPPKPKPPGRSRGTKGRPKRPLSEHPRRFLLACYDALFSICGSARLAAGVVVELECGRQTDSRGAKLTLKATDRLRVLARRHDAPADMAWREAVGDAIRNTFLAKLAGKDFPSFINLERIIVKRAGFVGEDAWARRVLLPLIEPKHAEATSDPTERAERVHRPKPHPDESDDARNDRLVRDLVNSLVSLFKEQPDKPLTEHEDEIGTVAEIEIMGTVIKVGEIELLHRILSPGPNVSVMLAEKNCEPN